MGNERSGPVLARLLASGLACVLTLPLLAGAARAATPGELGLVFRADGFASGEADISQGSITCAIPTTTGAIADGAYNMGIWNTLGVPTILFPDPNSPVGNPCGGWIELRNQMLVQGINLSRVELQFRIAGAGRFRNRVPTSRGFPAACANLRKARLFIGGRLNAIGTPDTQVVSTNSGEPNVLFVQLVPMVSPQLIQCLRSQYTPIPSTEFSSFPLVIRAKAYGVTDNGDKVRTNTVNYTLTMRHVCGNGRVDDIEECDPEAPNNCLLGACTNGFCGTSNVPCFSDQDCTGSCQAIGTPIECTCVF